MSIEIFFGEDTEYSEFESINRGYRLDVFVKIDQSIYNISVYSIIRLCQDFRTEFVQSGFYLMEKNLVLVNDTRKQDIILTIIELVKCKHFLSLKEDNSIEVNDLYKVY